MNVALEPGEVAARVRMQLSTCWWLFALRGLIAMVFAAQCLVRPGSDIGNLAGDFALYAVVDGAFGLAAALWRAPAPGRNWLLAVDALASFVAAIVVLTRPGLSQFALALVIGLRSGIGGIMMLMTATRFAGHAGLTLFFLAGMASILLAALLLIAPIAGLAWPLGVYLLVFGGLMLGLALQLRQPEA